MLDPDEAEAVLRQEAADLRARTGRRSGHRQRLLARDTPLLRERLSRRDPSDHDRIA